MLQVVCIVEVRLSSSSLLVSIPRSVHPGTPILRPSRDNFPANESIDSDSLILSRSKSVFRVWSRASLTLSAPMCLDLIEAQSVFEFSASPICIINATVVAPTSFSLTGIGPASPPSPSLSDIFFTGVLLDHQASKAFKPIKRTNLVFFLSTATQTVDDTYSDNRLEHQPLTIDGKSRPSTIHHRRKIHSAYLFMGTKYTWNNEVAQVTKDYESRGKEARQKKPQVDAHGIEGLPMALRFPIPTLHTPPIPIPIFHPHSQLPLQFLNNPSKPSSDTFRKVKSQRQFNTYS
ncbi:hypothetical protein LXL04_009317 [Taraxacum kok-saghyz]